MVILTDWKHHVKWNAAHKLKLFTKCKNSISSNKPEMYKIISTAHINNILHQSMNRLFFLIWKNPPNFFLFFKVLKVKLQPGYGHLSIDILLINKRKQKTKKNPKKLIDLSLQAQWSNSSLKKSHLRKWKIVLYPIEPWQTNAGWGRAGRWEDRPCGSWRLLKCLKWRLLIGRSIRPGGLYWRHDFNNNLYEI